MAYKLVAIIVDLSAYCGGTHLCWAIVQTQTQTSDSVQTQKSDSVLPVFCCSGSGSCMLQPLAVFSLDALGIEDINIATIEELGMHMHWERVNDWHL